MTSLGQILSEIARTHLLIPTLDTRRSDALDFHNVSVWAVEAALAAAYEAGRASVESDDIDPVAVLARRKQIAAIWSIEDVKGIRSDLTDEQAWDVLEQVERKHDAEWGINWTTLETTADDLFPRPTSRRRKP